MSTLPSSIPTPSAAAGGPLVEVRVDEPVCDVTGLESLGVQVGDFVALDANPTITSAGYVKSRHLDDKAGIAAALGAFKSLLDADPSFDLSIWHGLPAPDPSSVRHVAKTGGSR